MRKLKGVGMDKKLNLSIIILCIIEIICCFTPYCLDEEFWKYEQSMVYHGVSSLKRHNDISFFGNDAILGKPLAILFVCTAVLVIVIYYIKMIGHTARIADKAWIFAIVHTAMMAIFLFYSCSFAEVDAISFRYAYGINWMSYVIIALNLIVLILSFLLKMEKKIDKLPIKKQSIIKEQKESVDDLLTYKELLDSGVISQEEFDAKKMQILGL